MSNDRLTRLIGQPLIFITLYLQIYVWIYDPIHPKTFTIGLLMCKYTVSCSKMWKMKTVCTLKCLSIGTPKAINFPFVSNEKLMFFRCPSIQAQCNKAVIYLNYGTPKNNEFSIWNKWKIYYF